MKSSLTRLIPSILLAATVVITLSEVFPYIASPLILHRPFNFVDLKRRVDVRNENPEELKHRELTAQDRNFEVGRYHVLHPYLGFVWEPSSDINNFGFFGPDPLKADKDSVKIYLTGGSVALGVFTSSKEYLKEKLIKSDKFKNRKFELFVIAFGGFKQPQQLMALAYLNSLGAKPDILVNLDGFNEVVLPFSENRQNGIFPSYPRMWNLYSRKHLDLDSILVIGRIKQNVDKRENERLSVRNSLFAPSNMRLFFWDLRDSALSQEHQELHNLLKQKLKSRNKDFQSFGPIYTELSSHDFFVQQAAVWMKSSVAMNKLMDGKNYFHFFQPNQYDTGSKVLSSEELNKAIAPPDFGYRVAVEQGYPIFRQESKFLLNQGIKYFDLGHLFIDDLKTVYTDKCCHLNRYGYDKLAEAIAQKIIDYQE